MNPRLPSATPGCRRRRGLLPHSEKYWASSAWVKYNGWAARQLPAHPLYRHYVLSRRLQILDLANEKLLHVLAVIRM